MRNLRNRLLSRIDRALVSGSYSVLFLLLISTAALVFVASTILSVSGVHATRDHLNFMDSMWEILQRAIDPGQLANEQAWSSRLILLTVTLVGLLLVSTLVSIINSTLERRIEGVRRGRRPVHLHDHVVIIGWNDGAMKLIEELAIARTEGVGLQVVLFTAEDPVELLNHITEHIHRKELIDQQSKTARKISEWITIRKAKGENTNDLLTLGNIDNARAIICLLEKSLEHRNTRIVLAILAALQSPQAEKRPSDKPLHVVAQYDSEDIAERLKTRIEKVVMARQQTFGGLLELQVVTPALVRNKLEVNVVRSRGLSAVYKDLLDFDGDEIYIAKPPHAGLSFGDLKPSNGCIPIGFIDSFGVDLWPSWDDEVGEKSVIAIGRSMDSVSAYLNRFLVPAVNNLPRRIGRVASVIPENYLFIGQNEWLKGLVEDLNLVAPQGSSATLLLRTGEIEGALPQFAGRAIDVVVRSSFNEPLDDDEFVSKFDHVVVLADHTISDEESDSRVLSDVLACRVHLESRDQSIQPMTVVAELRQRSSRHIAAIRMADDLLVSDALTACAIAQFALYPENGTVLRHLLSEKTSAFLQGIPASEIIGNERPISWIETQEILQKTTGEIGIAVRTFDQITGIPVVQLNPNDDVLVRPQDDIVVLTHLFNNLED